MIFMDDIVVFESTNYEGKTTDEIKKTLIGAREQKIKGK